MTILIRVAVLLSVATLAFVAGTLAMPPFSVVVECGKAICDQPDDDLVKRGAHRYMPTHEQETWIGVLEWCESRGKGIAAVNPKDRDGTPSYYFFQFKPETFEGYLLKYQLALPTSSERVMELMENYELTREVVRRMIGDKDVDWYQEFPDCVLRLGEPPR